MENISKQIALMESLDSKTSAKAIRKLKNWITEGLAIPQLVEYYATCQSIRALELLCLVHEPYDKILLDKMLEHMSKNRHGTLVLMGLIVQKAPGWLAKIPHHNLFRTIMESIELNEEKKYISGAILFITSIMLYSTTLNEPLIEQLIDVFVKTCRILENEATAIGEISQAGGGVSSEKLMRSMHVQSIKFAVINFFHALYALYPCHVIHNLQMLNLASSALGKIIEEIVLTVRLHPALIFENRNAELSRERWMRKEPHDFFNLTRKLSASVPFSADCVGDIETKRNTMKDERNFVDQACQNISEFLHDISNDTLQIDNFVDNRPLLHSGLNTPPLSANSDRNNAPLALQHYESVNGLISADANGGSSLLQKFSGIFRRPNVSTEIDRKISKTPHQTDERIVEYTGFSGADDTSESEMTYRNIEWAIECVESLEYESLERKEDTFSLDVKSQLLNEQPSTSGTQRSSEKRTTSESYANPPNSTRHFLNSQSLYYCRLTKKSILQPLARALSLTNLNDSKDVRDRFIYSKNTSSNICSKCLAKKESNTLLAQNFEKTRHAYINSSIAHHAKMKELNLASRTPERMYDDMQHIIKELPLERQCEVLLARLQLVNQHLLFERYCRLLHENRNRRLFGKLKKERTDEAEHQNFMELEHNISTDLENQVELYGKLHGEYTALKTRHAQNEDRFVNELQKYRKENDTLSFQLKILRHKYESLVATRDVEQKRLNQELLQKENLIADKKLMEFKLKEVRFVKTEFIRLQQEKRYLEAQLEKKIEKSDFPRKRAEDMMAPLYEAQLKNARLQLRKIKMALNRAVEKNEMLESRWKEELDRRFDLQSMLNRASLVHSKNLDSATHKFNALLAICNKQEAHIFNLHRALEQSEAKNNELSKTKPILIEGEPTAATKSMPTAKQPSSAFNCDNSYIFSDMENHARIVDLFSSFKKPNTAPDEESIMTRLESNNTHQNMHSSKNETPTSSKNLSAGMQKKLCALNDVKACSPTGSISSLPDDPNVHEP